MYHPYFRGKQYELITIRETASILAQSNFLPIIEPVRQSLGALERALLAVRKANGSAVVVVNPFHGDHANQGSGISEFLANGCSDYEGISAGILLTEEMTVAAIADLCSTHSAHPLSLIHAGFTDSGSLTSVLGASLNGMRHIFLDELSGKLYRRHFSAGTRVLLKDGFKKRRNRDHPQVELFSDLHITYTDEGMNGFGDFLIVGDEYADSGGPAYAVAIHLTFIDPSKDNAMYIYHFVSDRQDTPTDPAGKFREALTKLMRKLNSPNHHLFETTAIRELRDLSHRGHFPGLGYLKKLSMTHHIETLAAYFQTHG